MGNLEKRIGELEEQSARTPPDKEEAGEPRPEVFGRYERAVERRRVAHEEAVKLGTKRVPATTEELRDATDDLRSARYELREYANSRVRGDGSESRDGKS
jgi:hypothetical protein